MLEDREGERIEYKLALNDNAIKTIVAFANSEGGTLYIGVDDEGTAVGLDDPDEQLLRLSSMLRDKVRPDIIMMTSCSIEEIDGAYVLVARVGRGARKPYYLAEKGLRPEGVYVRSGAASVPSSDTAILRMIKETEGDTFETEVALDQELTFDYARAQFEARGLPLGADEMRTLGMADAAGRYTNVGLLLSDQCPPFLKAARFDDDERDSFAARHEYRGCILKQLDEAYAFLDACNHFRSHVEGLRRVDFYDYPAVALREALVNSVAHRDFALSGPTLVSVMPSSVEIVSLGGLPRGIERPDLEAHISMPRNRLLASILFRLEVIEAYGTGIMRMRHSYRDMPCGVSIEVTPNAFVVRLPNRNTIEEGELPDARKAQDASVFEFALVNMENGEEISLEEIFGSGMRTRQEIQDKVKMSQSGTIRMLNALVEEGVVAKVGKGKATRYHLKKPRTA